MPRLRKNFFVCSPPRRRGHSLDSCGQRAAQGEEPTLLAGFKALDHSFVAVALAGARLVALTRGLSAAKLERVRRACAITLG